MACCTILFTLNKRLFLYSSRFAWPFLYKNFDFFVIQYFSSTFLCLPVIRCFFLQSVNVYFHMACFTDLFALNKILLFHHFSFFSFFYKVLKCFVTKDFSNTLKIDVSISLD